MKVAIIGPQGLPIPPVKGGAIETLIDVILKENENQKKLSIDVYTIYDQEAINAAKQYKNVNFYFLCKNENYVKIRNKIISGIRKFFKVEIPYTYASQICKRLKNKDYDKVVIEGDSTLILPIKSTIGKEKVIFHIHHDPQVTNHEQFKKELNNCNQVIAVSDYINQGIKACTNDSFNCVTLKNCFRLISHSKDDLVYSRSGLGINLMDIVIVFSGRPIPNKGVKELLLAFKELVMTYSNIKLLIVGNPGFGNQVKTTYEEELHLISKEICERVIFTGYVPHDRMNEIYQLADIGVIPSIYNDPAPLVVIECMAAGLPLVVTDSGGIPEYVSQDCAIILERDDQLMKKLKDSIELLIHNSSLRSKMGLASKARSTLYSEKIYYNNFCKILNDLEGSNKL